MNLLALPLEREQIYSIKRRFPGYSGKVGRSLLAAMPQRYPKKLASGQKKTSRPFLAAMAARRRPAQTNVPRSEATESRSQHIRTPPPARRESARPGQETCPLLSRLRWALPFEWLQKPCRLEMAKRKIDEPTIEYAAGRQGDCLAVTPGLRA